MKGKLVERKCLVCEKSFIAEMSEVKQGQAKYCSQACYHAHPKSESMRNKVSVATKAAVAKGRPNNLPTGSKHHNWNGGVSTPSHKMRSSPEWRKWREAVFKRDSYRCFDCGEGGYLEPHHIIPLKHDLTKAYELTNGITLCRPCHVLTMGKEMAKATMYASLIQLRV